MTKLLTYLRDNPIALVLVMGLVLFGTLVTPEAWLGYVLRMLATVFVIWAAINWILSSGFHDLLERSIQFVRGDSDVESGDSQREIEPVISDSSGEAEGTGDTSRN